MNQQSKLVVLSSILSILWSCSPIGPGPDKGNTPPTAPPPAPASAPQSTDKTAAPAVVVRPGMTGKSLIGATQADLHNLLGEPNQIMDATIMGRPPAEAWVYAPRGKSSCMDAYVVDEKSGKVENYFCR